MMYIFIHETYISIEPNWAKLCLYVGNWVWIKGAGEHEGVGANPTLAG